MPICSIARSQLVDLLGSSEAISILKLSDQQERIEFQWRKRMRAQIAETLKAVLADSRKKQKLSFAKVDFSYFLMLHRYEVMKAGILSTRHTTPVRLTQLSKDPAADSLAKLRRWWDRYRKSGVLSPDEAKHAKIIRKKFLEKIQDAWKRAGDDFLSGDVATQEIAVNYIQQEAQVVFSRAKMIVETETTRYFNKARREVYDQSPDVTHYLFMAIRDHRTTEWCRDRHGLVYKKGDPLLDEETPPIHWYCRSEMLPLTMQNANHKAIILDLNRARRLHVCKPLPPGWNKSA